MKTKNKKTIIWTASVVVSLALIFGAFTIYASDYYRADTDAIAAFCSGNTVSKTELSKGKIAYGTDGASAGFIFYPGGKVEHTAYEPLMVELASRGILCVLVEMPFNLAVFDMNAADGIRESYPDIEKWYIGGHSLGGSMAASYVAEHTEDFDGLILLAAYSTADLSETSLKALSIFGGSDNVMNRKKYGECKKNLPPNFKEIVIEGGCHAYFGMYGEQDGDGEPLISAEEQIRTSAEYILDFIREAQN